MSKEVNIGSQVKFEFQGELTGISKQMTKDKTGFNIFAQVVNETEVALVNINKLEPVEIRKEEKVESTTEGKE